MNMKLLGRLKDIILESRDYDWALEFNNPMALIQTSPSDWDGLVKGSKGRLKFEEMWYGVRAGVKNLNNSYFKRGNNTLEGIFKVYAPYGHGSNDPENYAKVVGEWMGVSVEEPLTFEKHGRKLAKSIINFETGIPVGSNGGVTYKDFNTGFNAAIM